MSGSENFTFPTKAQDQFIVGDRLNLTWSVTAPLISLYESCGTVNTPLEGRHFPTLPSLNQAKLKSNSNRTTV